MSLPETGKMIHSETTEVGAELGAKTKNSEKSNSTSIMPENQKQHLI